MATFPTLKTGAVAQYPAERSVRFATVVHRFVDGSEQRFGLMSSALRRWVIRLDELDEAELFALEEFLVEQNGAAGVFEFTDPWDGTAYPECRLEGDDIELVFESIGRGHTELIVRENR